MKKKERKELQQFTKKRGGVVFFSDEVHEDWYPDEEGDVITISIEALGCGFVGELDENFGFKPFNVAPVDEDLLAAVFVRPRCMDCGGGLEEETSEE